MQLNGTREKQLAIAVLISLAAISARAESGAAKCNPSISTNCSCTMPLLERELGVESTRFLAEIWERAYAGSIAQEDDFFLRRAKEILPISLRYGQIKYFVASACGALAFEDGNE